MFSFVNSHWTSVFVILAVLLLCGAVTAQENSSAGAGTDAGADSAVERDETPARDEADRWVPSFSVSAGIMSQRVEGSIVTTEVLGPPVNPPTFPGSAGYTGPQPLQPLSPLADRNRMMTPYVAGAFEVMTPKLFSGLAKPRLFAHGDVAFGFPPEYEIVTIGTPGPFMTGQTRGRLNEASILGQGTTVWAQVDSLLVFAGFGVAFTFDVWDRTFRLKPSVEYVREKVEIRAVTRRAIALITPANNLNQFRYVTLLGPPTEKVFNALGPGIELELDTRRAGSFVLSVFVDAQAHWFLGDRSPDLKITLRDENQFGEAAEWGFLKNRWGFLGQVGLRFRYLPE